VTSAKIPRSAAMSHHARISVLALAAAALLALPLSASAASTPKSETAQGGNVSATLTWVKSGPFQFGRTRLTIVRGGTTALNAAKVAPFCPGGSQCARADDAQPLGASAGAR
jgi:hypothetical protein